MNIGKKSTVLLCDALLKSAESRLNSKNIEFIPRFVEIFDDLLLHFKNDANLVSFTSKFCQFCSKYIKDFPLEIKCCIFNYYANVLYFDRHSFILNQDKILNSSTLSSQSLIMDSDLGTEGRIYRTIIIT